LQHTSLFVALLGCVLVPATARAADIQVHLSIEGGKTHFHTGDTILLDLTFTTDTPGVDVKASNSRWPFSGDTVVLTPMQGVFPWYDDEVRGHPYVSDAVAIQSLQPSQSAMVRLALTDLYRFDQPGTYRVHVVTQRSGSELTSNEVEFSFEPLSPQEESALAVSLEKQIREAKDMQQARAFVDQLDTLPGDAATQSKIRLFLQPKAFEPFALDVTQGLWMAQNRPMIVSALESALNDPHQPVVNNLLQLLVEFKARLEVPYDARNPAAALPTKALEATYVHQLAQTLPARTGDNQVDAARTVMFYAVQQGQTSSADFAAAREIVITHFNLVDLWTLDTLLNQYGKYLMDARILPALQQFVEQAGDPKFSGARAAVLTQMARLQPEDVANYLVREACSQHPAPLRQVRDLTKQATLPGVDDCLRTKLLTETSEHLTRRRDLAETLEYIARFATDSLVPDVRQAYLARTEDWDQSARGAAVTYLMRWDADRSLPLLTELLPENDPSRAMWLFLLAPAYPPADGLRTVFRKGLVSSSGRAAGTYAYALAQIGSEEDRELIREQLRQLQSRAALNPVDGDSVSETDMIDAINHGRSWDSTPQEKVALEQSCVTSGCKQRFANGPSNP
jgi:hypothetical protein